MFAPGKLFQPSVMLVSEAGFCVGATFEMIRTELREICISIDHEPGVAAPFKWKRERQGSGETERERDECVCECRSTPE